MPIKNEYVVVAAAIGFLLAPFLTGGSLMGAFGILALVAGMGWAVAAERDPAMAMSSKSTSRNECDP